MTDLPKTRTIFSPNGGFTLIEILIAVAIVMIVSAVGIAGFNSAGKSNAVKQSSAEIKSLGRKLRTDASAAVKPIGTCTTSGTVYGTYLNVKRTNTIEYGTLCFDPPSAGCSAGDYSEVNTKQFTGLFVGNSLNPGGNTSATAFFSFDGTVRYFFYAAAATKPYPTRDQILNLSCASSVTESTSTQQNLIINDGNSFNQAGSNRYVLRINRFGLICEQRLPVVGNCAQ